jgi:hypothetical protein
VNASAHTTRKGGTPLCYALRSVTEYPIEGVKLILQFIMLFQITIANDNLNTIKNQTISFLEKTSPQPDACNAPIGSFWASCQNYYLYTCGNCAIKCDCRKNDGNWAQTTYGLTNGMCDYLAWPQGGTICLVNNNGWFYRS